MTTATEPDSRLAIPDCRPVRGIPAPLLKALHAEWRKLSPNLAIEPLEGETPKDAERRVRLEWTNARIKRGSRSRSEREGIASRGKPPTPESRIANRDSEGKPTPIVSWSDLSQGEAKRLLKLMREESGDGPAYRAQFIARLAVDLWGSDWDSFLGERLRDRFHVNRAQDLTPREARAMIEELKSRAERGKEAATSAAPRKPEAVPAPAGQQARRSEEERGV